ncbi:MAG TPA: inositol monophosphatase family protein [Thermodesulfobacteriota bacterium]|nr:inositol monophosphatase family protein [Thermodesulfobacteriota bacterium]
MKIDDRHVQLAMAAAKEAGRIQMHHFGHSHPVEYKGEFNPVTEVDRLCEQAVVRMILDAYPDHDILTEESPFKGKGSSWKWIIDPIDGTTNYLHGFPCFCVSIGLEVEGEVKLGVIYVPPLNELFHSEKGKGAFLNGRRITVSQVERLNRSLLCTGFPYDVHEHTDFYLRYFRQFISRSFAIRRPGSAAIDLSYLAAGRFDGFWEFKLHAWDVAAATLMITEAGGRVTDLQGRPHDIYSEEILASNGFIHEEMLQAIREIDKG